MPLTRHRVVGDAVLSRQMKLAVGAQSMSVSAPLAHSLDWIRWLWQRVFPQARAGTWVSRYDAAPSGKSDTVAAWPPQAARVLTDAEAQALDLARRAAPTALVLAQVPLWRFVRVSSRHSYAQWLSRVGHINADLLVCDGQGTVLAVIDVHREPMSERSQRRHERLRRVLRATETPVLVWQQGRLPSLVKARAQLASHGIDCAERSGAAEGTQVPRSLHPTVNATVPTPWPARKQEAVPSDFLGLHTVPSTAL